MTKTLTVALGDRSYPIWIGCGTRADDALWKKALAPGRVAVLTNDVVGPLYAQSVIEKLKTLGYQPVLITLPDGEQNKDWKNLNRVFDALMENRFERGETLVALGGGVIGDMGGFAAACYQRGMRFVQMPTTLLAQVDSSVGGKTAINHPLGKNMIGAFYQPAAVIIDLDFLGTLAAREFSAGLAEIIKYGCILDAAFFAWLEANMPRFIARDANALAQAVYRSCELKAQVVASDERESGLRAILNFGHTFGHAIEAGTGYQTWLHGEAVGCGMLMAARLSQALGGLAVADVERIGRLIQAAGLPTKPPQWQPSQYLQWMSHDKKAKEGKLRYIVLRGLGSAAIEPVEDQTVSAVIEKSIAQAS